MKANNDENEKKEDRKEVQAPSSFFISNIVADSVFEIPIEFGKTLLKSIRGFNSHQDNDNADNTAVSINEYTENISDNSSSLLDELPNSDIDITEEITDSVSSIFNNFDF